ncbi:DUF1127 domain-containing protein [Rhodobacter sp. TJ_12]|uniref:DUF1127 domain-containing protein n=1 Tax=Rhodobacter sp. TJ_12 TaxID=2029399 RepID=UPI001CC0D759|nr:DUF1127 domain-containing protein [Rhodobacter sp. TJ_12]
MSALLSRLFDVVEKRARYTHTRNEIARLSPRLCCDLGICPDEAAKLAHRAVYGA